MQNSRSGTQKTCWITHEGPLLQILLLPKATWNIGKWKCYKRDSKQLGFTKWFESISVCVLLFILRESWVMMAVLDWVDYYCVGLVSCLWDKWSATNMSNFLKLLSKIDAIWHASLAYLCHLSEFNQTPWHEDTVSNNDRLWEIDICHLHDLNTVTQLEGWGCLRTK